MAIRVDTFQLNLDAPEETPEGYLILDSIFARVGVLEYLQPDGSILRELVLPEELSNPESLESYNLKPITVEHPPEMVTVENYDQYAVGKVVGPGEYMDGFVRGKIVIDTKEGIRAIREKNLRMMSAAYRVDIEETSGVHPLFGQFDRIQRRRYSNHVALTKNGRAGPLVAVRADSDIATLNSEKNMANKKEKTKLVFDSLSEQEQELIVSTLEKINFDTALSGLENTDRESSKRLAAILKTWRSDSESKTDALQRELEEATKKVEELEKAKTDLEADLQTRTDEKESLEGQFEALMVTVNEDAKDKDKEDEDEDEKKDEDDEKKEDESDDEEKKKDEDDDGEEKKKDSRVEWYNTRRKLEKMAEALRVDTADDVENEDLKRAIVGTFLKKDATGLSETKVDGALEIIETRLDARKKSYERAGDKGLQTETRKDQKDAESQYQEKLANAWRA